MKRAAIAAIDGVYQVHRSAGDPGPARGGRPPNQRPLGHQLHSAQAVISCGAKHAIFNLLMALVDEGDEVIAPSPYWVSYPDMAGLCGGKFVAAPVEEWNFHLDLKAIEQKITQRTRVLILNSPNNPTGAVYDREELAEVVALCAKRGVFILSDEIYEKLVYPAPGGAPREFISAAVFAKEFPDTIAVVSGCSKTYAMTGWRIGWARRT